MTTTTPHMTELRAHLMATLADLRNRDQPMEPDRARAVAQVASVLIDSAKVENDYLKMTGQDRSEFLELPATDIDSHLARIVHSKPSAHNPFPTTQHRLQG